MSANAVRPADNKHERGSIVIITLIVMLTLLGLMGLAIDFGYAYLLRNRLQAMTDAAALSCASANARTPGSCVSGDTNLTNPTVLGAVDPYGYPILATVPETCPNESASSCVKVTGTLTWNTFFLPWFNLPTLTVNTASIAGSAGTACLQGLSSTGTNITFNNTQTSVFRCWIASRSTSGSSILVQPAATVSSTVGWTSAGNISGTLSAPVELPNRTPIPDPYIERTPPTVGSCIATNYEHKTCNPLPAGTYCGLVISPGNCGTLTLSGTYVIRAGTKAKFPGLTFDGHQGATIQGQNVTFYIVDGSVHTDAQKGNVNLSPPTTGPLRNLLFWQAASNTNPLIIDGDKLAAGRSMQFQGVTYAPGASVTVQRGNHGTISVRDIVANRIFILSSIDVSPTDSEIADRFRPNVVLLD